MRIIVVFLMLVLAYGTVSYSPQAATPQKLYSVGLGGVTGATNNTVLAFGRFVLIAPFWPSKGVADNGELDLTQLDNCFIYAVDTKKPDSEPVRKELSAFLAKEGKQTVYFPTKLAFDPDSGNVYVRGTRFQETTGEVTAVDVIAYAHIDLEDGKLVFDSDVVKIDIEGVSSKTTGEAPLDLAFSANGGVVVFTNGASIFSYRLDQGYLYEAQIVHPSQYGADDRISFLDVDQATNIVTVCENRKSVDKNNVVTFSSEVSFYKLGVQGTFDKLRRAFADQLLDGKALANGSNVAIVSDADSDFALFATNDGSLCAVDLGSDEVRLTVKTLYTFPDLASVEGSGQSPLFVQYDSSKRVIGIVKPGVTIQISRPTNGRRARISRPTNILSTHPGLAMAKLGKRNRVTSVATFNEEFKGEGGLTNFVSVQDSEWLISTYSGKFYSVGVASDVQESRLELIGSIGSPVDRLDYYADGASVVAISPFMLEEDGIRMATPGSLLVGNVPDILSKSRKAIVQALLPNASLLGRSAPSIRRPCNIKR